MVLKDGREIIPVNITLVLFIYFWTLSLFFFYRKCCVGIVNYLDIGQGVNKEQDLKITRQVGECELASEVAQIVHGNSQDKSSMWRNLL